MFHIIHRILYECLKDDETDKKEKKILQIVCNNQDMRSKKVFI